MAADQDSQVAHLLELSDSLQRAGLLEAGQPLTVAMLKVLSERVRTDRVTFLLARLQAEVP